MALRVNIRHVKGVVYVACVLAAAGAVVQFLELYTAKKEKRFTAREDAVYRELLHRDLSGAQVQLGTDLPGQAVLDSLHLARVDGSLPPQAEEAPEADLTEATTSEVAVTPLEDVLQLGMVLYHEAPAHRLIAITFAEDAQVDIQSKEHRLYFGEGDTLLPPYDAEPYLGRVEAIGLQEVTFSWGGEQVVISPALGVEGDAPPLSEFDVAAVRDPWEGRDVLPDESLELEPGVWLIGREDREHVSRNLDALLDSEMSMRTIHKPEGGASELEVTGVAPDSLPARLGVESGDRIISVNGIPMPSVAAAINWGKANPDLPRYEIRLERRGKPIRIVVNNKSDA